MCVYGVVDEGLRVTEVCQLMIARNKSPLIRGLSSKLVIETEEVIMSRKANEA